MKKTFLVAIIVIMLSLASGCGGASTLTLNEPIEAGPAIITITDIKTAKVIEGNDPLPEYDLDTGEPIEETITTKPKNGMFLLMTYDIKNNTDKSLMAGEPQIRTEKGKYISGDTAAFLLNYDTAVKGPSSYMGTELRSKETVEGIISIYDVPTNESLELAIVDAYEASNFSDIMLNSSNKSALYKIDSVPKPSSKAIIGETTIDYE